jgi:glucose/mannose-6-phosphate isomerase
MLDDLKYIHERDGQDALGLAEKQYQQLNQSYDLPDLSGDYQNIVIAGMGGSALSAQLAYNWPGLKIPMAICRGYDIPTFVNESTLFIASSYSGNTEETLSALSQAETSGAKIITIKSGGRLEELSSQRHYVSVVLPRVTQPRYAVFYSFKALVTILQKAGLVDVEQTNRELTKAAGFLESIVGQWRPDVPTEHNYPKQIALELAGKSVVIYSGPKMSSAAYKWKISINENAKNVAWWNQIPEFNHNEMIGWSSHPIEKPYAVVNLLSSYEHQRVQRRFEVTDRLLSGLRPAAVNISAQGETLIEHLLWQVVMGDFTSIYLALLNGVNPTPVDLVEKFKRELG